MRILDERAGAPKEVREEVGEHVHRAFVGRERGERHPVHVQLHRPGTQPELEELGFGVPKVFGGGEDGFALGFGSGGGDLAVAVIPSR
jgi:hypothetical protein